MAGTEANRPKPVSRTNPLPIGSATARPASYAATRRCTWSSTYQVTLYDYVRASPFYTISNTGLIYGGRWRYYLVNELMSSSSYEINRKSTLPEHHHAFGN